MDFKISSGRIDLPYRVVIYGPEGIGKSTLAAQFPRPLFADTEGSTLRIDVPRIDPRPTSWAMLLAYAEHVRDNPGVCGTFVVDTADWAERMCQRAVCDRSKKGGIEDFGYGKGYTYAFEEFGKLLNLLTEIQQRGDHVVLTAHAAMRKFEQPDEMGAYDRWEMKMHKSICAMVKEWADLVLFANYKTYVIAADDAGKRHKAQGGARVLYTTHNPCWDAKNRFGMPDELPMEYGAIAKYLFPSAAPSPAAGRSYAPAEASGLSSELVAPGGAPSSSSATPAPVVPAPVAPAPSAPQTPAPATTPVAPAPAPGPVQTEPTDDNRWAGIPEPLAQLMRGNGVEPEEIMYIVSDQKGYYPHGTLIRNYARDFVDGWCIGMWDKVLAAVKENRESDPF